MAFATITFPITIFCPYVFHLKKKKNSIDTRYQKHNNSKFNKNEKFLI